MTEAIRIAVIGGSGLYHMQGLSDVEEREIDTPFGKPSGAVVVGTLGGARVAFLARHGQGHRLSPSEVNYRANIFALKTLGVERILAVSACGSLREHLPPGDIVVPAQIFDFTRGRERSFFGRGLVAHVSTADPFCPDLSARLVESVRAAGHPGGHGHIHSGETFLTVEGPRFSTKAESKLFRSWGMDIIGMTSAPEAFLAREAEMCYAIMAHVTDYDVWHDAAEPVSVEMVVQRLKQNTALAQQAIADLVGRVQAAPRACDCGSALAGALITDRAAIPAATLEELRPIVGKYL